MPNLNISINLVLYTRGIENMFFLFAAFFCIFLDNYHVPSVLFSVTKQFQIFQSFLWYVFSRLLICSSPVQYSMFNICTQIW